VLLASVGACFMAASTELIMIFIGLEISSISTYILAGLRRHDLKSNEASLKYFLLGSFATAFFLYGVAFVYGLTGTTKLAPWTEPVPSLGLGVQGPGTHQIVGQLYHTLGDPSLMWVALILLFVGLAFKVSTVPFQVWTPDVYQGAPAPVTAFLSTGPKAAAFAVVLRLFVGGVAGFANLRVIWIVSAVLTMSLGNLAALRQSNLKRLLAYSAIAHAGYVLVGVAAAPAGSSAEGTSAVLFYLVAYSLMNLGAFLLLGHLAGAGEGRTDVEDYVGLAYRKPGVAACLSVFLLSLAGFPTTAGFLAKFYVFRAAIHAHLAWLIVIALLNSVISAYYYLRLVVVMYMREGKTEVLTEAVPWPLRAALAASVLGIFYLGLFPNLFLNLANLAASPLPYFGLPY
jgi:NADH-quinone oxidoreductase subunit N